MMRRVGATGRQHSVCELAASAFAEIGVTLRWAGSWGEETGVVGALDAGRLAGATRTEG